MRYATLNGVFEIDSLPSQPQLAVCHAFHVHEDRRGRGLSHELHKQQIHVLENQAYDYALCTVTGENQAQRKALAKAGWSLLDQFHNRKRGEVTQIWGRKIELHV